MPETGWKLATGWRSKAEMDTTPGFDLGNFPRQGDQGVGRDWMRPDNESDIVERAATTVDSLTNARFGYGEAYFRWRLRALTPLMVRYLENTIFGSAFYAKVTTRGFNRATGEFEYYNALAHFEPRESHTAAAGGYDLYTINFVEAVEAPDGPRINVEKNAFSPIFTVGAMNAFAIGISNVGSADTYGDTTFSDEIPTSTEFVSISGSGWAFEYSTDDGETWSGTVPSPASDTTNVRGTYSGTIATGGNASTILMFVEPQAAGTISNTAEADTEGNLTPGGSSDTVEVDVEGSAWSSGFDFGFGNS